MIKNRQDPLRTNQWPQITFFENSQNSSESDQERAQFSKYLPPHHFAPSPFSSPGSTYCAPSQGDMKSNCRYSCTSDTGS